MKHAIVANSKWFENLQVVYAGFTLFRWSDVVRSQASVGITGVFLVTFTVSGGLGICALLGLTFNASTTQIVPFLALGLGVDAMFVMVHTYSEMMAQGYVVEVRCFHIFFIKKHQECLLLSLVNVDQSRVDQIYSAIQPKLDEYNILSTWVSL
jgi:hypothetical protein